MANPSKPLVFIANSANGTKFFGTKQVADYYGLSSKRFKCRIVTSKPVILVVEDDFLIRSGAADMVRDLGFEAIEAADADKAIELLEQSNAIAVVFTDIQMPGSMDGLRLVAVVRDRWPPVALLVTSGQVKPLADHMPPGTHFLSKPYLKAELKSHLESLLN